MYYIDIIEHKIEDSKISVSGTGPDVDHNSYIVSHNAEKNISAIYLHLFDIDEPHSVRSVEKGYKTQKLK